MLKNIKSNFPFVYFLLLAVVLFTGNGHSLTDQDEAAYAGFARQMIESGNWVTPEFMWSEVHRKPPLHFWNIALSYKLFGVNEFAVRFPSALFVLLTCLLVFWAGKKIANEQTALLWAVVMSTSLLIPALAKISVTDSTLLFFTTACTISLYFILHERAWKWVGVFWISFALALLTKGPPVVLFAFIFIALLFIFHPQRKNLIMLHPWFFLPLAVLPLVAWGYATLQYDDGKFVKWMIDWYILKRVSGGVFGQTGFPGMHLLMIILFFLPWLLFLPQAFRNIVSAFFKDKEGLFFAAWFVAAWFIYELSPSKLPAYVVAAHVPLAFFVAQQLAAKKLPAKGWIVLHFFLFLVLFSAIAFLPFVVELPSTTKLIFITIGIVLLAAMIFSVLQLKNESFIPALIGVNVLFQVALWLVLVPAADELKNITQRVAAYVSENADKDSKVYISNAQNRPPSLPFYLGNNFNAVQDEFNFSVLMSAYYGADPCALILSEKQHDLFIQLIPEIETTKLEAPGVMKSMFSTYYVLLKERVNETNDTLFIPDWLKLPEPREHYRQQMLNNVEWFADEQRKAKERNLTIDEMLDSDANWIYENELARHNYLLQMLQTLRWRKNLESKATEQGLSLEEACKNEAEFIFSQGRVY